MITDRTLGQTVVVQRCDIPRAPMLKLPSVCELTCIAAASLKKGILRTDRSPHTEMVAVPVE